MITEITSFYMPGVPVQLQDKKLVVSIPKTFVNAAFLDGTASSTMPAYKVSLSGGSLLRNSYRDKDLVPFGDEVFRQVLSEMQHTLKKELPALIGKEVEKRVSDGLDAQKVHFTKEIESVKAAIPNEKRLSLVTISTSFLSLGKFTEAYTKTLEVVQSLGQAVGPQSNVDKASFPRQLGGAMVRGAKGALKLGAATLGAVVMVASMWAAASTALNQVEKKLAHVPYVAEIVLSAKALMQDVKISIGPVEIENTATKVPKTLSMAERATRLLAQHGGDYGQTITSVNFSLTAAYVDGNENTIESNTKLLNTLNDMKTLSSLQAVAAKNSVETLKALKNGMEPAVLVVAPTPESGPAM